MSNPLHSMRRYLVVVALLLGVGPAAAATIHTTHARDLDPTHHDLVYLPEMQARGASGTSGAYVTFWTRDNWKSAMFRVSFPAASPATKFILNCVCLVPATAANYNSSTPYGSILLWMPAPKNKPLRLKFATMVYNGNPWNPQHAPVHRDAWDAIPQMSLEHWFFGGELRHIARVTLDDRSVARYNFALGDVPAKRGFITGDAPAATRLSALSQPALSGSPAPVPLPATGLLVLTALAALSLARRWTARA